MTTSTETLERELVQDLDGLGDRLRDDRLVRDLYRALTNTVLEKDGGRVSLSWQRAEEILSVARSGQALPSVDGLAQSGGEGEIAERAQAVLEELGWSAKPLNTGRHDDAHASNPESPPPRDGEAPAWEQQAHEEAESNRHAPPKL
jgi:hypothetical protein